MFKIILLIAATWAADIQAPLCAYWCDSSCTLKATSFYCCSFEPSLTGPKEFLPPPCQNLCLNSTHNGPAYERNCKTEIEELTAAGAFKICRTFKDCDASIHDLCCQNNCVPENQKICIKL